MPRIKCLVLLIIVLFFTCNYEDNIPKSTLILSPPVYSEKELILLNDINEYRVDNGLPILILNDEVSSVSDTHTRYLSENQVVNHDNAVERYVHITQIMGAESFGEIVAYGYTTSESVLNAWVNSDSHRETLDNQYFNEIGVSIETDIQGRYYYVCILVKL